MDIQRVLDDGRAAEVPEGITQIASSIRLGPGATIRGASRGLSILEVVAPDIDAFLRDAPVDSRDGITIENLTIRTVQPGVTGIRTSLSGGNQYKGLTFQGTAYTLRLDRGLDHTIDDVRVETWGANLVGSLICEGQAGGYCQLVAIDNYRTLYQAAMAPMIFSRATNVTAGRIRMHAPLTTGIVIEDDCQGLGFVNCSLVGVMNGAYITSANGRVPQLIDFTSFMVDQHSEFGIKIEAGADVGIYGGCVSNGWQGIYVGTYPAVERTTIMSRAAQMAHNGIVVESGGRFFDISHTRASGNVNAGIVVSPGASDDYTLAHNDCSCGNGAGLIDAGTGIRKSVIGNR